MRVEAERRPGLTVVAPDGQLDGMDDQAGDGRTGRLRTDRESMRPVRLRSGLFCPSLH